MSKREKTFPTAKKDSEVMLVQIKEWGLKLKDSVGFLPLNCQDFPAFHLITLVC